MCGAQRLRIISNAAAHSKLTECSRRGFDHGFQDEETETQRDK